MLKTVIFFSGLVALVSALSCVPCDMRPAPQCPKLDCSTSERVRGQCECCDKCGLSSGQKCTETDPCLSTLRCYAIDKDPSLPWFFNGICVTNETYHSLPAEPVPCGPVCDRKLWMYKQQQAATKAPPTTVAPPPPAATAAALEGESKAISAFVSWIRQRIGRRKL